VTASFGSVAAAAVATAVTDVVVAKPAGTSAGDLLLAFCWSNAGATTWSSGSSLFTPEANNGVPTTGGGSAVLSRIAGGSEPADYTFTRAANTTNNAGAIIVRIPAGTFDDADPLGAISFGITGAGGAVTIATQTVPNDDSLLLQFASKAAVGLATFTPPGTATERVDATATGSASVDYAVGDEVVDDGLTGTRVWAYSPNSPSRGAMVSINPATGGPPPATDGAEWDGATEVGLEAFEWNGTAEVPLSVSEWDGATEVPLV